MNPAQKAWQTRWAKKNKKYVDYPQQKKMVKQTKNKNRALKAWETMRKRGYVSKKGKFSSHIKNYNVEGKNKFRDKVISSFKKLGDWRNKCLTLESPDYLFVKTLKDFEFIIIEHSEKQYINLCKNVPKNVKYIYHNDLSLICILEHDYDCAFIDLCRTFDGSKNLLKYIAPKLHHCTKIAFTFSLRGNNKSMEDYKFDLINKLQKIFPQYDVEYGNAYRDGSPMVGIILSNRDKIGIEKPDEYDINMGEIIKWCNSECKRKFGHELYTYGDLVINPRARTYKVKNINICKYLFNNLPINHKKALRRWKTYFDRAYCDYKLLAPTRYNDNIGATTFEYFIDILCK